ncbi:MAG: hypothetical protein RLP44_09540 [Aggregatilineales bacterium]
MAYAEDKSIRVNKLEQTVINGVGFGADEVLIPLSFWAGTAEISSRYDVDLVAYSKDRKGLQELDIKSLQHNHDVNISFGEDGEMFIEVTDRKTLDKVAVITIGTEGELIFAVSDDDFIKAKLTV